MNTRRQTVWLVSMLGLMVVLSAYYLFTDDVDQVPVAGDMTNVSHIEVSGAELMDPAAQLNGEVNLDSIASVEETLEGAGTTAEAAESNEAATETGAGETVLTDEQVLEQLNAQTTGSDAITALQMERAVQFAERNEELTKAITDQSATETEIAEAIQAHDRLMDLDQKLIAFEEKLSADYDNVVVTFDQEKSFYTVNVNSSGLERSEAVSIIRAAMDDLGISMNQISVKQFR